MNIEQHISDVVLRTVTALYGEVAPAQIQIQKTRKEFAGDYTLVTFPLLKASRKSPEATATEIGERIVAENSEFSAFNVIKGFLNLSLDASFWSARRIVLERSLCRDCCRRALRRGRTDGSQHYD